MIVKNNIGKMNRKIEFRGYNEERCEYVFGNLASYRVDWDIHYYITGTHNPMDMLKPQRVTADSVGQFTGFFDINNVEIYEGDILKQTRKSNKSDYKVIRSSMSAAFVLVPTNLEMMNDSFMVLTEVFVQNEGLKVDLSIYNEKKTNRK